jgi:hypothetical protein
MKNRIAAFLPAAWRPREGREESFHVPDAKELVESAEYFVARHPGVCLAAAFAMGVLTAWWIKRK